MAERNNQTYRPPAAISTIFPFRNRSKQKYVISARRTLYLICQCPPPHSSGDFRNPKRSIGCATSMPIREIVSAFNGLLLDGDYENFGYGWVSRQKYLPLILQGRIEPQYLGGATGSALATCLFVNNTAVTSQSPLPLLKCPARQRGAPAPNQLRQSLDSDADCCALRLIVHKNNK